MKQHFHLFHFYFFILALVVLTVTGCQLFGPGSESEDISSLLNATPPTTGNANVKLNVVFPGQKNDKNAVAPTIRASSRAQVIFRLIIVNPGNEQNPTSILNKMVEVDESGQAEVSFSGVPAQTAVCQLKIEGGSLGGKTDFHGASDLKSGNNEVTVTPVGSGDKNDVLAGVLINVVANPELIKNAPLNLAQKVLEATEFVLAGGSEGPDAYQEAFNRTLTTNTFTTLVLKTITVNFDGSVKLDGDGGWNKSAADIWQGISGGESLLARRVLRQGLGATKPPLVSFSDVAKKRFGLGMLDPETGKLIAHIISDGQTLHNLSAVFVRPDNNDILVGGTANGLPVLFQWTATGSASITWPPVSGEVSKSYSFPGLASSTSLKEPTVEYIDIDPVVRDIINVVVRDPATQMLREYRVLATGEVVPRIPIVENQPVQLWPLTAMAADKSVVISWDKVPNAESYNLYYSFDGEVASGTKLANVTSPHIVDGLQNGLNYYFKLTWNIGGQEFGPSRIVPATPRDPASVVATFTASINGVWEFVRVDANGVRIDATAEPMKVILRQTAGNPVFAIDPGQFEDNGYTWLQTSYDCRVNGNDLKWADVRIAQGKMGYRTSWKATVKGNSLAGQGEDILGSSFGGYLTPGDLKGAEFNDRWYFVATRTSNIAPDPVVPTVTYNNSYLQGILFCASANGNLLVKADGFGGMDFSTFDHATGSYKIEADGAFTMESKTLTDTLVKYTGKLTGKNTGTITPDGGTAMTIVPIANRGVAQGIWSGKLSIGTVNTYVTFVVTSDGGIEQLGGDSLNVINWGHMFISPDGNGRMVIATSVDNNSAPNQYFSVDGKLANNIFTGTLRAKNFSDVTGTCTLKRLIIGAKVPALNDMIGTWELLREVKPSGVVVEYFPNSAGQRLTYTFTSDGKSVMQAYGTNETGAGIEFTTDADAPLTCPIAVKGMVFEETHSEMGNIVIQYQPSILPDGSMRWFKSYAKNTDGSEHEDVGSAYIFKRKVTANSMLSGAWILKISDNKLFYLVSDGAGKITDFGTIASNGGNYSVQEDGKFTVNIDPDGDDPMVITGQLAGTTGTWISGSLTGTMHKVGNPSFAQGTWSGSLTVQYSNYSTGKIETASNDVVFSVDANGKVTSVTGNGITSLRGGHMFILPEGDAKVLIRTNNARDNAWWEFSVSGRLNGDQIYGLVHNDGASEAGVTPSYGTIKRGLPTVEVVPTLSEITGFWKATIIDPESQGGDTWNTYFRVAEADGKPVVEILDPYNWSTGATYSDGVLAFTRIMNFGNAIQYTQSWSIKPKSATLMAEGILEDAGAFGSISAVRYDSFPLVNADLLHGSWNIVRSKTPGAYNIDTITGYSANPDGKMANFTLHEDGNMTGILYKTGVRSGIGQMVPYLNEVVDEGPLSYVWSITDDLIRWGDEDASHYEIWKATRLLDDSAPQTYTMYKLELIIDNDTPSRTGEIMYIQKTAAATTVAVTGVSLNKTSTSLTVGQNETLVATIAPADATNKTLAWSSADSTIVSVTSAGVINGVKTGTAKITVTTADGSFSATCEVTVTAAAAAGEPAAADKAAIESIYTKYTDLIVRTNVNGDTLVASDLDSLRPHISPSYANYGRNADNWDEEWLQAPEEDENMQSLNLTGWQYRQIDADTWLVARLGSITKKDSSIVELTDLSQYWQHRQYTSNLDMIFNASSNNDDFPSLIEIFRKENGEWKMLGNQERVNWTAIILQFQRNGINNSVNTTLFTYLNEIADFPVASVVASGSFINGTINLTKVEGSSNWNNWNAGNDCNYTGIAPNNPGAKIGMKVTFTDGTIQTYVFSQPDTSGIQLLSVTVSEDGKTFEWDAIAPQDKLNFKEIAFWDNAGRMSAPYFRTEDATVAQHSFSDQDLALLSGKTVQIHVTEWQNDGIGLDYWTQKTFP